MLLKFKEKLVQIIFSTLQINSIERLNYITFLSDELYKKQDQGTTHKKKKKKNKYIWKLSFLFKEIFSIRKTLFLYNIYIYIYIYFSYHSCRNIFLLQSFRVVFRMFYANTLGQPTSAT